jgi:hypothetical protein
VSGFLGDSVLLSLMGSFLSVQERRTLTLGLFGATLLLVVFVDLLLIFFPSSPVPDTIHVAFNEAEHLESGDHEFLFSLDVADNVHVVVVFTDEVLAGLVELEALEPFREYFFSDLGSVVGLVERVSSQLLNALLNFVPVSSEVLLEVNSLSDQVTLHGFFFELEELSNLLVVLSTLHLTADEVTSCSDGIH